MAVAAYFPIGLAAGFGVGFFAAAGLAVGFGAGFFAAVDLAAAAFFTTGLAAGFGAGFFAAAGLAAAFFAAGLAAGFFATGFAVFGAVFPAESGAVGFLSVFGFPGVPGSFAGLLLTAMKFSFCSGWIVSAVLKGTTATLIES